MKIEDDNNKNLGTNSNFKEDEKSYSYEAEK